MVTRTQRTGVLAGDNGIHSLKTTVETTEEEFCHVQEFRPIPQPGSEHDFPSEFLDLLLQRSNGLLTFCPDEGKSRNG